MVVKAVKAKENAGPREEGRVFEEEEEETPIEEADTPEEKMRVNAIDGDGEEKENAAYVLSENETQTNLLVCNIFCQIRQTAWLILW